MQRKKTTGCYLLHFDTPLAHARHYLGYARDIDARIAAHTAGQGARLMAVCKERGIGFQLVRVWPGANRLDERKLKNRKNGPALCPRCHPPKKGTPCYP